MMITDEMADAFGLTVAGNGGYTYGARDGRMVLDSGALEVWLKSDGTFSFDIAFNGLEDVTVDRLLLALGECDAFIRRCVEIIESFKQDYRDNLAEIMADEDEMGDE